jgi:hypothetical protein
MWKILNASCAGTSHLKSGQPCQDHASADVVEAGDERALVAACADGAGSAAFSEVGARLACARIVQQITGAVENGLQVGQIDRAQVLQWCRAVRADLEAEAQGREVPMRELACTLLLAVVGKTAAAFAQIGDGAIVVRKDDAYQAAFWPQSGEYVNTTNFLTDTEWERRLEFKTEEGSVIDVALFTDGLQPLVLDYAEKAPYARFFGPMFARLRDSQAPDELLVQLRRFLDSPRVNDRTDDDKTLILATRLAADGALQIV